MVPTCLFEASILYFSFRSVTTTKNYQRWQETPFSPHRSRISIEGKHTDMDITTQKEFSLILRRNSTSESLSSSSTTINFGCFSHQLEPLPQPIQFSKKTSTTERIHSTLPSCQATEGIRTKKSNTSPRIPWLIAPNYSAVVFPAKKSWILLIDNLYSVALFGAIVSIDSFYCKWADLLDIFLKLG